MAELALKMLNEGLQAFAERDEDLARKVCADDDAVDDLYNQIYRELLTYMLEDPRNIQRATTCCGWRTTWSGLLTARPISPSELSG